MRSLRAGLRNTAFVGPRTSGTIAVLLMIVGIVAGVVSVGYAIDGATRAPVGVAVPVALHSDAAVVGHDPAVAQVEGVALPDGANLQVADRGLRLVPSVGTSSRWTNVLARGDVAAYGLALGVCAFLLAPVISAVGAGEPFRRGSAARIGWTGGIVLFVGMLAPMLPQLASMMILDRLGLARPGSPFTIGFALDLAPIGLSALVFVIAEAFRRGGQISADAAGLV
jgi:hypothetical protein